MLEDTPYSSVKLLTFVKAMNQVTRFGNSRDLSLFFSTDKSEKNQYVAGIWIVFFFLMAVGICWFLLLAILRLLGQRVGCASGNSATIPAEAMRDKKSTFDDTATEGSGEFVVMQADQSRINRIRVTFFVCGACAVAMAGFFVYSAIGIQLSFNRLYKNFAEIHSLFTNVPQDRTHLNQAIDEIDIAKNLLSEQLVEFCTHSKDYSDLASNLTQALTDMFIPSPTFVWAEEAKDLTKMIVDSLDFAETPASIWFICSMVFTFLSVLGTVFFLLLAWKSGNAGFEFVGEMESTRSLKLIRFVAFPLYTVLAFLAWFAAGAAFAGATVNSDFCFDEISTGHGVHKILEQKGFDPNSTTYKAFDSYLHDCSDRDLAPIESELNINDAMVLGQNFLELLGDGGSTVCSNDDVEYVTVLTTNTTNLMTDLQTQVLSITSDISCEEIAPLLQKSVYQSGCQSLVTDFMLTWLSLLGLATCCTLILTLRSATHRPQIYIVPPNDEIEPIDSYDGTRVGKRV